MIKNTNLLLLVLVFALLAGSCNNYRSMSQVSSVGQLKGNPFMYNLSKSVLKSLKSYASKSGANSSGKMNLLTPISSVFTTGEQISGLKDMLTLSYQVPTKKINSEFNKVITVKDLITLIARYGKGFNFYSSNSSL